MAYPDRPAAPRPSWEPDDCVVAKNMLIYQLNEAMKAFQEQYDKLMKVADTICKRARGLRAIYSNDVTAVDLNCVLGFERACDYANLLTKIYSKQSDSLEKRIMDAIDLMDCGSADWYDRWWDAVELLNDYFGLERELKGDIRDLMKKFQKALDRCHEGITLPPEPAQNAVDPVPNEDYDPADPNSPQFVLNVRQFYPLDPATLVPTPNVGSTPPAGKPCGCGGTP